MQGVRQTLNFVLKVLIPLKVILPKIKPYTQILILNIQRYLILYMLKLQRTIQFLQELFINLPEFGFNYITPRISILSNIIRKSFFL